MKINYHQKRMFGTTGPFKNDIKKNKNHMRQRDNSGEWTNFCGSLKKIEFCYSLDT